MYNFVVLKMLTISFFETIHMIYLARLTRFDIFPYCVHFRWIKPLKKNDTKKHLTYLKTLVQSNNTVEDLADATTFFSYDNLYS